LSRSEDQTRDQRQLEHMIGRMRVILLVEQLWRLVVPLLVLGGLYVTLAFLGLWLEVPHPARAVAVAGFVLAALFFFARFRHLRSPGRETILAELDRRSGLPHRPALAQDDALAAGGDDPTTRALWQAHRRRLAAWLKRLRPGGPRPGLAERDPLALRIGIIVALAASAFVAGPEKYPRFLAGFDWRITGAIGAQSRVDAWFDPPAYTGRPPIVLDLVNGGNNGPITVPVGSQLIVHGSAGEVTVDPDAGLVAVQAPDKPAANELRLRLQRSAHLVIRHDGSRLPSFDISALPDNPPTISLIRSPQSNASGSLTLSYRVADDYGVVRAEAEFSDPELDGRKPDRAAPDAAPRVPLNLPPGASGLGEAQTIADLTAHPWAGLTVKLTLVAHDEGGNDGRSASVFTTLPQRGFKNPLARALVEQRRELLLFPSRREDIVTALEALTIGPEEFGLPAGQYLALRVVRDLVAHPPSAGDDGEAAEILWRMALDMEDGNLSAAERDLRAAVQALREAITRGASPDEIAKRAQDMQRAMQRYLAEMQRNQARKQGREPEAQGNGKAETVTPEALADMLDKLSRMAQSGDAAQAEAALDRLQQLLENLRVESARQAQKRRAMGQMLRELDDLSRQQQDLRDDTYRNGSEPGQGAPQSGGASGSGEARDGTLASRERNLREKLDALRDRLGAQGNDREFEAAQEAMRDAENALRQNGADRDGAIDAQGRALDSLRKSAENLASRMQGDNGEADDDSEGRPGQPGNQGRDPLGRPMGRGDVGPNSERLGGPPSVPVLQRAQKVLEELRRRLSNPDRPREELDYFERLLKMR
jgi:uncharacterized protein (TIGR02302 family)